MKPPWDSSFPSSHPTQSRSPLPEIRYDAKGKEHRTLTHPLCYEVLEIDLSFKKKKNHHRPPPTSVSIPEKLSIISYPQSEVRQSF